MYLCYKTPAAPNFSGWQQRAIPLGNGSIGVKVFGGVQREMIQFNEKTLFSGNLDKIGSFQNFGEIFISFNGKVPCSENTYLRDFDLETGSSMVACQKGLDGHTRHYFVSAPDNVFVGKLESTGETMLDFTLSLQSEQNGSITYDGAYAYIRGTVNANNGIGKESSDSKNDLEYLCCVKVIPDDGEIITGNDGITVKDTFGAMIIMSCSTDYYGKEELEKCLSNVGSASEKSFPQLYKRHLEDYRKIMGRTKLNILQSDENVTTDIQLRMYPKGKYKADIEALLFEMGKYILYSTSRRLSLPMTECGIWNSLNVQEKGEILIDTAKAKKAYATAKELNMNEVCLSLDAFLKDHSENKRYDPFGAKKEFIKPVEEKKSAFSKLFKKEHTPVRPDVLLENAVAFASLKGKEKDAYKNLSDTVLCAYDTLFMPDIFDNISFTDAVRKMLISDPVDGIIEILPCLPIEWDIGSVSGITIGIFEFSIEWSGRRLKKGCVTAKESGVCRIYCDGKFIGVSDETGNDIKENFENGTVSFDVIKDKTYNLY